MHSAAGAPGTGSRCLSGSLPLPAFSRHRCVAEGSQRRPPSSPSLNPCSLALSSPQNRLGVSCPLQIACTAAAALVRGRYRRGDGWQPLATPGHEGLLRRFPGQGRPPNSAQTPVAESRVPTLRYPTAPAGLCCAAVLTSACPAPASQSRLHEAFLCLALLPRCLRSPLVGSDQANPTRHTPQPLFEAADFY